MKRHTVCDPISASSTIVFLKGADLEKNGAKLVQSGGVKLVQKTVQNRCKIMSVQRGSV